jgi:hypothetical protein
LTFHFKISTSASPIATSGITIFFIEPCTPLLLINY